ncbi:hypothetical protein [Qipengyuania sp.]|uniref:hypothetical protein n=1 Tax=Qipengyuania sp. TaxID=2004515 RepID=UPI0035C87510
MTVATSFGACASQRYAGLDLRPGAAPADIQQLARVTQSGSKQAQLDLGIRLQEGRGIPVDHGKAARPFARVATDSAENRMLFVPAAGSLRSTILPIRQGTKITRSAEARARLQTLESSKTTSQERSSGAPTFIHAKTSAMIEAVDQLSRQREKLSLHDLQVAFQVKLERDEKYQGYGQLYHKRGGEPGVSVFVLPNGDLRLSIELNADQPVEQWRDELLHKGWRSFDQIRHPFIQDTFRRNETELRIEHNTSTVSNITVFGLHASQAF